MKDKELILSLAVFINKELFNSDKISYKMYKYTEENILKELKLLKTNLSEDNKIGFIYN